MRVLHEGPRGADLLGHGAKSASRSANVMMIVLGVERTVDDHCELRRTRLVRQGRQRSTRSTRIVRVARSYLNRTKYGGAV